MNRHALAAACGILAVLAACSSYGPRNVQAGQTADEVAAQMGAPSGRYPLPGGGTRLEYARGPYGKHTYMIDLDPQGRVTRWEQVLTEKNFATIRSGMSDDEVLMRIGRPSEIKPGGWQGGKFWSYRYDATFCLWFQVGVKDGRVTDAGYTPDPLCDADDDARSSS